MEAHYLCAVLNSNIINENIKPLQPRGLFGERAVTRRPFLFPIPHFNNKNPNHTQLAELSKSCHDKLSAKHFRKANVAHLRREARGILADEIKRIDDLVVKIVNYETGP